jgi:hypothetical protein
MADETEGWPPATPNHHRCGNGRSQACEYRVRSFKWEGFPRREFRRPRERLGPIKSSNIRAQKWPKSDYAK